jgi:hypothetical protein
VGRVGRVGLVGRKRRAGEPHVSCQMTKYPCTLGRALTVAMAIVSLAAALAKAQPLASKTTAKLTKNWTPSRTPWGDPDLQGVFTNSNEYATPLERPEQFAGRRLEDVTVEELADIRRTAQQRMIDALPGGRVRGPDDWWLPLLDLGKRSQPWSIVDPPDGRIPALTPEAQKRAQLAGRVRSSFVGGPFDGPEDFGPLERCISRSVPGSMIPVMYGNSYQIVQTPGFVAITYEIVHEARIVPLDGRPHVGRAIREHMGDARGHWEGETLVVETTNFTTLAAYRGADPSTLRVVERFTRVAPDRIDWAATIDDPRTWTRPWTISMPLTADPHPILAFECHEGNYGLRNILSAARAQERSKP